MFSDVAIKKSNTVFNIIKSSNIENVDVLRKSGVYERNCGECIKVYLGKAVFCEVQGT